MSDAKVAVVVLNYNGRHFLEKFLPGVIALSSPHKIAVADNASSDGSCEWLEENHPSVQVIQNGSNLGFAGGYNEALRHVDAEYFILLNNDVEVTDGWIYPLLSIMSDSPHIAACQP